MARKKAPLPTPPPDSATQARCGCGSATRHLSPLFPECNGPIPESDMTKDDGEPDPPRVAEVIAPDESSLFEGLELEISTPSSLTRPDDGIPPLDSDLTADEKSQFIKLLNKEMPIAVRAKQLGVLARLKGTKTAAVGLRAIQEINSLTGLSKEEAADSAPLFQLPADTTVSVQITKVVK